MLAPTATVKDCVWHRNPLGAVGNLRFTAAGVYADYLLSGLPFIFLSEDWQNSVAAEHAELWRSLPSGSSLSGLTVPVPARNLTRRMLYTHHDLRPRDVRPRTAFPPTVSPWAAIAARGNPPSPRTGRGAGSTGCRFRSTTVCRCRPPPEPGSRCSTR